jgi:hypothetical protein
MVYTIKKAKIPVIILMLLGSRVCSGGVVDCFNDIGHIWGGRFPN